jgi:DNA ligase-1
LLACYDEENEEYQTICKLGTGLKDEDLTTQFESLSKIKIDKPKAYYSFNETLDKPDHVSFFKLLIKIKKIPYLTY